MPLLSIEELDVVYHDDGGDVPAVERVSLTVEPSEVLAVVGESGCGKTSLALAVTRLIQPPGAIPHGRVLFRGEDLLRVPPERLRAIRGREIGYVFQDPSTSLNPVLTMGNQLREAITLHTDRRGREADADAEQLLAEVGIPSPGERLAAYPHELSGGMRQRVMIAMAIAPGPSLLIADEPTTALDVTVQVQILQLLMRLQRARQMAVVFITHDLTLVERVCHRVAVMYAGRLVEVGPVDQVFRRPAHPYTMGLLACRPTRLAAGQPLAVIAGQAPDLSSLPAGCRFHPRCPVAEPRCSEALPELTAVEPNRVVRCVKPFSKSGA